MHNIVSVNFGDDEKNCSLMVTLKIKTFSQNYVVQYGLLAENRQVYDIFLVNHGNDKKVVH